MEWMPNKLAGHGLAVHPPLMFEHDPKKEKSAINNLPKCNQPTKLDKPARLSFSCSLDLLLMSIKQIKIEISETAIGCLEKRRVKGAKTKNQRAVQLEFMSVHFDPAVITNYQNYQLTRALPHSHASAFLQRQLLYLKILEKRGSSHHMIPTLTTAL